MDNVTKWAKNLELATALGWRAFEETEWWEETRDSGPYLCKALMGTAPDGAKERLLPDFFGSVDVTLATLPDTYTASTYPGTFSPFQGFIDDAEAVAFGWTGDGDTRASGLAEARLAMALEQQAGTP